MSNDNRRGPGRGPMRHGRGMMPGEKAKDFKGTMKKLMSYLGKYTYAIIAVFIFAIGSVAFSVIGPNVSISFVNLDNTSPLVVLSK